MELICLESGKTSYFILSLLYSLFCNDCTLFIYFLKIFWLKDFIANCHNYSVYVMSLFAKCFGVLQLMFHFIKKKEYKKRIFELRYSFIYITLGSPLKILKRCKLPWNIPSGNFSKESQFGLNSRLFDSFAQNTAPNYS